MNIKVLNHVSIATILFVVVNILIVVLSNAFNVAFVSAIFGWLVVVGTQLSLISVRNSKQ